MHFFPILSTLRRHRTAARADRHRDRADLRDRVQRDLPDRRPPGAHGSLERYRRGRAGARRVHWHRHAQRSGRIDRPGRHRPAQHPGVKSVASMNMIPFGGSSWNTGISLISSEDPNALNAGMYMGTDIIPTLGLRLVAGRDFNSDEYVEYQAAREKKAHVPSVIVTRGAAERLFPARVRSARWCTSGARSRRPWVGIVEEIAPAQRGQRRRAQPVLDVPAGQAAVHRRR